VITLPKSVIIDKVSVQKLGGHKQGKSMIFMKIKILLCKQRVLSQLFVIIIHFGIEVFVQKERWEWN
jgi:hypothetical protein